MGKETIKIIESFTFEDFEKVLIEILLGGLVMNNKEKLIEEMAKIIDDRLIEASGVIGSMNNGKGYWIAQKLVENYQPKLPEDSVVLSREEWDAWNNAYAKRRRYAIKEARKDTAEKILKAVLEDVGAFFAGDIVKKLAEEYCVEEEE